MCQAHVYIAIPTSHTNKHSKTQKKKKNKIPESETFLQIMKGNKQTKYIGVRKYTHQGTQRERLSAEQRGSQEAEAQSLFEA